MPNMGYGYIKIGEKLNYKCNLDIYRVANFIEKPNFEMAKDFYISWQLFVE